MLKAVFFDLDGTLLPLDEEEFIHIYFNLLYAKVKDYGFEKEALINTILLGTKQMVLNDGKKTNEEVFWQYFTSVFGKEKLKYKLAFDEFYQNEFKKIKAICGANPLARHIIEFAQKQVDYVVLSTNPIFPKVGTLTRMSFIGLNEADFNFITTYENSSYCKPNPEYFRALLNKFNLKPSEVILFGNNDIEDYTCAKQIGIDCFLVGDYLLLSNNIDCPKIKMEDVIAKIKEEKELRK